MRRPPGCTTGTGRRMESRSTLRYMLSEKNSSVSAGGARRRATASLDRAVNAASGSPERGAGRPRAGQDGGRTTAALAGRCGSGSTRTGRCARRSEPPGRRVAESGLTFTTSGVALPASRPPAASRCDDRALPARERSPAGQQGRPGGAVAAAARCLDPLVQLRVPVLPPAAVAVCVRGVGQARWVRARRTKTSARTGMV